MFSIYGKFLGLFYCTLRACVYFVSLFSVVSTTAFDCLERLVSKMSGYVSSVS